VQLIDPICKIEKVFDCLFMVVKRPSTLADTLLFYFFLNNRKPKWIVKHPWNRGKYVSLPQFHIHIKSDFSNQQNTE
jgi:hypothetical protein